MVFAVQSKTGSSERVDDEARDFAERRRSMGERRMMDFGRPSGLTWTDHFRVTGAPGT
jgi:hypothetical protein